MQLHQELTAFLSPESTPIHRRQVSGIANTANNNRSRLPFIIAFAVLVPIAIAVAFGTWYCRTRRRALLAGNRQPPARGNQSWGKRNVRNNRASAAAPTGGAMIKPLPPLPVHAGTPAPGATGPNANKDVTGSWMLSPQVGGSSNEAPPSYVDAIASEEGRARY